MPNLNVGLGLVFGLCGGALANPASIDEYDWWYEYFQEGEASALCGPELNCRAVDSRGACTEGDGCFIDGGYLNDGEHWCCYSNTGFNSSMNDCFNVVGYENAEYLIVDYYDTKIKGGAIFSNISTGKWNLGPNGTLVWGKRLFVDGTCTYADTYTYDASVPSVCQDGYWATAEIIEEEEKCYVCEGDNFISCSYDSYESEQLQCKDGYYIAWNGSEGVTCTQCPEVDMNTSTGCADRGESYGFNWGPEACFAKSDTDYCDATGVFEFNNNCYYSN